MLVLLTSAREAPLEGETARISGLPARLRGLTLVNALDLEVRGISGTQFCCP